MYELNPKIHDLVKKSILITGSARSGTSIFGKLIGTLETVEYFFEPPTLFSLFSVLKSLPRSEARLLFDTFVYEELLMGALSGRAINLREQDDSSIFHTKSKKEIALRLQGAMRKIDINAFKSNIAIKIPDFVYGVSHIAKVLDLHRLIILIRDPGETINSLLNRGWFSDSSLRAGITTWPNRLESKVNIPHWVPIDYLEEWSSMHEVDRAALYFITQTEIPDSLPRSSLIINYHQMIKSPNLLLENVANHLGLSFGPCTAAVLNEVGSQPTTRKHDLRILRRELRERINQVFLSTSERCITF